MLSRFANVISVHSRLALQKVVLDQFIAWFGEPPARLTFDIDTEHDPAPGQQQPVLFHERYTSATSDHMRLERSGRHVRAHSDCLPVSVSRWYVVDVASGNHEVRSEPAGYQPSCGDHESSGRFDSAEYGVRRAHGRHYSSQPKRVVCTTSSLSYLRLYE